MSRTSFWLGLALWGLVMYVIPFDALVTILFIMGSLSLLGVCVMLMGYIVYKVNGGPYD